MSLLIRNISVIDPENKISGPCDILIENGRISKISRSISVSARKTLNGNSLSICPGFVDIHCHLRDPGFTWKEDLKTGGKAALAGGFTCICPLANTNPVLDNPDSLRDIILRGELLNGPAIIPFSALSRGLRGEEAVDFEAQIRAGALSFSDDGNYLENRNILSRALKFSKTGGVRLALHEEWTRFGAGTPESEVKAINADLELLAKTGGAIHIMHISLKESCNIIEKAKKSGLDVTCEVTPHHLILTERDTKSHGVNARCNPPLRTEEDRDSLVEALENGTINIVATDHAPHSPQEKNVLYSNAPNGIVGFQTAFSVLLQLVHQKRLSLLRAVESMSLAPAKAFNIGTRGRIFEGGFADLAILNLNKEFIFREEDMLSKSKNSPFIGRTFQGGIKGTIHEGRIKYISKLL